MNRFLAWLWSFLPDKCEEAGDFGGCCRKGIRGNENEVDGRILCDYCLAEWKRRGWLYSR